MKEELQKKLSELPKEPGVYLYKDANRQIIYVGKAAILRNRVRSYFQAKAKLDYKTQILVGEIADIEWITTQSEIDALFLESELIKRYKPKYNIELRDDKHYLYVRIPMKEKYPAVTFVRRPLDDGANYFGPYIESFSLRKALRYLRKTFPYSTHTRFPKRVCLQYHLGLCPGVEESKITSTEYKKTLNKLSMFLKGRRSLLIKQIEREMQQSAKRHDFEQAAQLRNQAHSLRALGKQIVFGDVERFDISRDQALNGLAKLLSLGKMPRRIEAYDISHISGTDNTASMVVFIDGVPVKSEYRKFKMIHPGNDDYSHIQEVITRRFSFQGPTLEKQLPDLLVIDGGRGQLSAAQEALKQLGLSISSIGLAKREETIIQRVYDKKLLTEKFHEIKLPKNSEILKLLMRMRDEAHRFAVSYHSLLRSKRLTASHLEEIPGIGPATRKKLIKRFGSLAGIKQASQEQLINALGRHRAKRLKQYLN